MPPSKPANGLAQKALVIIFGAVIIAMVGGLGAFFNWLAGSTMDIRDRTTRIEERATRIEEKVGSLLVTRTDQAREQSNRNTRRLDELEDSDHSRSNPSAPQN